MLSAMDNRTDFDESERTEPCRLALHPVTIEKVFTDCVMDLKRILVLDGIDILPDGFRIGCHDLHAASRTGDEEQRRYPPRQEPTGH